MKTGNSKLFRKLALNRRSNRVGTVSHPKIDLAIQPVPNYWKAVTIKGNLDA